MLYMDGFVHLSYHCKYYNQFLVLMSTLTSSFMLGFQSIFFYRSFFVSRFCFVRNRLSVSMGFLCCRNRKAWSLNFVPQLLSVRGISKTLTPGPWTPLRTWSTTRPPRPLLYGPPKAIIKMTIIDLTYRLFFVSRWRNLDCYPAQILQIYIYIYIYIYLYIGSLCFDFSVVECSIR